MCGRSGNRPARAKFCCCSGSAAPALACEMGGWERQGGSRVSAKMRTHYGCVCVRIMDALQSVGGSVARGDHRTAPISPPRNSIIQGQQRTHAFAGGGGCGCPAAPAARSSPLGLCCAHSMTSLQQQQVPEMACFELGDRLGAVSPVWACNRRRRAQQTSSTHASKRATTASGHPRPGFDHTHTPHTRRLIV